MTALLTVYLPLVVAYVATFGWVWDMWHFREAYYAHGPLVVAVAAWIVWARRKRLATMGSRVDPRGWLLLAPALLAHLAGAALTVDSLSAASLGIAIPGAVLLAHGGARFRDLLPVFGLLLFAIPTPLVVQSRLAFELKELAVTGGLALANLVGTGAERFGAEVRIPGESHALIVADACSGLRSLVALVTLGYGVAFFLGSQRGLRPWVLLLAAAPIAVATNAIRIGAICVMAGAWGTDFAATTGHDIVSVLVWVLALAALLGLDALLSRRARRRGA